MNDDTMTAERPADSRLDDAEWDARVKLAAAYRLVEYYGWTEQIYGHLTARVPGPENHFLYSRSFRSRSGQLSGHATVCRGRNRVRRPDAQARPD